MNKDRILNKLVLCSLGILCAASSGVAGWKSWNAAEEDPYPGSTQKTRYGRLWPPYARPEGKEASFVHQFHYNKYWPYPHTCEDRGSVREIMAQQRQVGWVTETTLYDLHFDEHTQLLNSSGITHLKWILFETPHQYRTIHVSGGAVADVNQVRVNHVQQAAAELLGTGPESVPQIIIRPFARPVLTPAQDVDLLRRSWISSMPSPRLEVPDANGNSSNSANQN